MKIFPPGKKKCVWMEAGVVSYKLCDNNYDCSTCAYDHAMQSKVAQQKEAAMPVPIESGKDQAKFTATWVDKMMQLPASKRKCRYMITGEVDRKICPNAYECGNCSFDQMMQERVQTEPIPVTLASQEGGFQLASDMYYHEGHTWAKPEYGGRVRVGLDDFAQKLMGKLSKIEMPDTGQKVGQGSAAFEVQREGQAAKVLSPVDGVVTRVNHRLLDHPELINESPYEMGWLLVIEPTKLRKNLKGLFYGDEAEKFVREERERLFKEAHDDTRMAADGGESMDDIFAELVGKDWSAFVKKFLRS
jgi:glycine cleavage system H lipoate-binding protein